MTFQSSAAQVHEHAVDVAHRADLSFAVSGQFTQQLAINLQPGNRLVGWAAYLIAYDRGIEFEDAGNEQLVMAHNSSNSMARLVLSPGGPVGAFDLRKHAGRILLPQDSFLAAGPGVRLRPYSHIRSLVSQRRPNGLVLLQADGEGWVFSGATGEVSHTQLEAGQTLAVRACAIAALGATIVVDRIEGVHSERIAADMDVATLRGPGGVWLQSMPGFQQVAPMVAQTYRLQNTTHQASLISESTNPVLQS